MREKRERKPVMLRLPLESLRLLEEIAERERRSKVQVVELAIETFHKLLIKS